MFIQACYIIVWIRQIVEQSDLATMGHLVVFVLVQLFKLRHLKVI
jgi:hypothetical protein